MPAHRGQRDLAGPLQQQQQTAANHVAQGAVGLFPPQGFAQLTRQLPTAAVGGRNSSRLPCDAGRPSPPQPQNATAENPLTPSEGGPLPRQGVKPTAGTGSTGWCR